MEYSVLPHFSAFYLYYLSGHLNKVNRFFHFLGVLIIFFGPFLLPVLGVSLIWLPVVPIVTLFCFLLGHLICGEGRIHMQGSWKWNIRALILMSFEAMNGRLKRHIQLAQQLYRPVVKLE